jgi:hypothetical protein
MKKLIIVSLSLCLIGPLTLQAQDNQMKVKVKKHYVKTKIKNPKYTKMASPGNDYVYIDQDWTWNTNTNSWDWNGNRWVTAPQPSQTWVPGHWLHTSMGWTWIDGYWK